MIQVAAGPLIGCLVFVVVAAFGTFVILISSDSFVQGSLYKDATSNVAFPFYDTALHTAALDHPSPGREKQWPTAVSAYNAYLSFASMSRTGRVHPSLGLPGPARRSDKVTVDGFSDR